MGLVKAQEQDLVLRLLLVMLAQDRALLLSNRDLLGSSKFAVSVEDKEQ